MAAAINAGDQFEVWLHGKLKAMNTDQDVFASYIRGILEGDDADDEKLEALEGILVEIATDGTTVAISREFLDKWNAFVKARNNNDDAARPDVDAQLATIMEKQAKAVVIEKKSTGVDKEYRNAILLQYSQVSDGEEDEEDEVESKEQGTSVASSGYSLAKNTNAEEIQKADKEKRDKAKAESEKKKAQDKANKEKQKQQQQERKEKEKKRTQKGERKR